MAAFGAAIGSFLSCGDVSRVPFPLCHVENGRGRGGEGESS
jgi:hypothetical protein